MRLIGFNGTYGVGKSEACKILREYVKQAGINREVTLVKFAQPLYDIQEYTYDRISSVYQRPNTFIKDRKLLQWLGTDWGRDTISTTLWVDIWKAEVKAALAAGHIVICDDIRFDNEGEAFKELGGYVVKIISDRAAERIDTNAGIANHKSEAGINTQYIDALVENNSTLEEYQNSLRYLFGRLGLA